MKEFEDGPTGNDAIPAVTAGGGAYQVCGVVPNVSVVDCRGVDDSDDIDRELQAIVEGSLAQPVQPRRLGGPDELPVTSARRVRRRKRLVEE